METTSEITAKIEFINWTYPPYCELCNVTFTSETNSEKHFTGNGHKNRLNTWRKYQDSEQLKDNKNVLCEICYKEMNTQKILDTHRESPAHQKEEKNKIIIQRLKEEYRQMKQKLIV